MKGFHFTSIIFLLISCNNNNGLVSKKKIDGKIIESGFINDSIFDGVTKFYDLNNHLESKIHFTKGIKNGIALNYHANGKVFDSSFYKNGFKNGSHYVYDTLGQLIYIDYYFNGHQFGGQTFFKDNKPFQYVFNNFEKKNIFSCGYDTIGIFAYNGDIINANIYTDKINGTETYGLFAYFLNPPNIQVKYSLGITEQRLDTRKTLSSFDNSKVFIDTFLNKPPVGWKYYMSAEYNDTVNNQKKFYFTTLEY